jgi:hypothetical protein
MFADRLNVCFGSEADMEASPCNVRFSPKSRNSFDRPGCLPLADIKESRNGGTSEFVSWPTSRRLICLNERVARPLFVVVELNEKLAACKDM